MNWVEKNFPGDQVVLSDGGLMILGLEDLLLGEPGVGVRTVELSIGAGDICECDI